MREFATRLKDLRTEKGLNQSTLATAIGVSQSMIVRWEKDECEPTASNLNAIANYFGVTADYLLGRTEF